MKTLCLRGRIFSGKGGGARFLNLAWVRQQVEEKSGFSPYPGTLNIRLTAGSTNLKRALVKAPGVEIVPVPGFYPGKLFRASLLGLGCAVVIPEVPGYREDVIEVISSVNLRKRFNLADCDLCEVEVTF